MTNYEFIYRYHTLITLAIILVAFGIGTLIVVIGNKIIDKWDRERNKKE